MKNKNTMLIQALLCAFLLVCFLGLQGVKSRQNVSAGAFGNAHVSNANYTFRHLAEKLGDAF